MILFVFEAEKREPRLFQAIKEIFLPREQSPIVCVYSCNIYHLYSRIKAYDVFGDSTSVDTVSILSDILQQRGDATLCDVNPSDVSEIYLFFDYDFHHHEQDCLKQDNEHIQELLELFDDETENGKLYISYPMVESIRYTKELPDADYIHYTVTRQMCLEENFKSRADRFSAYPSLDHLLLSANPKESDAKRQQRFDLAKRNWLHLINMNVCKANFLCTGRNAMPERKACIAQPVVFSRQLCDYVYGDGCSVAVLNSFPIFLYDYLQALPSAAVI